MRSAIRSGESLVGLLALASVFALALLRHVRDRPVKPRGAASAPATGAFGTTRSSDEPHRLQEKRAAEPARGREAEAPTQIPWRGWKDVLIRTYHEIVEDRLLAIAAGVVFYLLLAIVPAITAFVSLYGLFAKTSTINEHLSFLASVIPGAAYDIIREQIDRIVSNSDGKLTLAFLVGVAVALWSANAGMKAIIDALNIIYEEDEKRGFIHLNLVSLAFTLGAIALLLIAIGAVVVFPLILGWLGLSSFTETVVAVLRWPALFVIVMTALAVLYRFGPSRREAKWRWVSVGSVVGALAWLLSSLLFSWYLSNFANYNATYGSLGAVIGLMMWMWLSVIAVLLGAELNAEMEHQTARDTTVGPKKPLGARGAAMADTVGEAAAS